MTRLPIGHYERLPVQLHDWTEDLFDAAARLIEMIGRDLPGVKVDHVGSTSVRGLRSKDIIDLAIETQTGRMDAAKRRLQRRLEAGGVNTGGDSGYKGVPNLKIACPVLLSPQSMSL